MNDTIFALATASGRAAVAVMRISGPSAGAALDRLTDRRPPPRMASVRRLRHPTSGEDIDQALVLWLPGPNSFTGEDVVEFHLHGGRAVVAATAEALSALGLGLAGPGEFTRRAFEHGRLDLSEAEAIADLVDAETEAQRRQALDQLGGALAKRAAGWRAALTEALAGLEAAIDFPDEDLPETVVTLATPPLYELRADLALAAADVRGERVRDGFHVALMGAPNAGKSSLLNLIAGRDAAIVTDVAGTTRDIIEIVLDLGGYRIVLADTAGIREAADLIEREGVRRARAKADDADLRLWVVDRHGRDGAWREAAHACREGDLLLLTKMDLPEGADDLAARAYAEISKIDVLEVSSLNEFSLESLNTVLSTRVTAFMSGAEAPALSRERHRASVTEGLSHLDRALAGNDPELIAEDVRLAARALERISGRIDSEAILDKVFSAFCIGK